MDSTSTQFDFTKSPAEPAVEGTASSRSAMLAIIRRTTHRARPAKRMAWLGTTSTVRQIPNDTAPIITALHAQFADEQLLAEKILERCPDGSLGLSPAFGTPSGCFALTYVGACAINAHSIRGSLLDASSALLEAARARTDGEALTSQRQVIIVRDDFELFVFASLGFATVSMNALWPLRAENIQTVFRSLSSNDRSCLWPPRSPSLVTICGCAIGDLIDSREPTVQLLTADLISLTTHHGFDSGLLFRIWLPTSRELAQFVSACQSANRALLRKQLSSSLQTSSYTPQVAANILRDRTPISFPDGLEELRQLVRDSDKFPLAGDLQSGLRRTKQAFHREVVSKIAAAPAGETGPLPAVRQHLAELAREWLDSHETIRVARRVTDGEHPQARPFSGAAFEHRLKIADLVCRLSRLFPPSC